MKKIFKEASNMENEIRYYLKELLKELDKEDTEFKVHYIVTAVKLPTGAIELTVNDNAIKEKIEYILESYNDSMQLKTNEDIVMTNVMVV